MGQSRCHRCYPMPPSQQALIADIYEKVEDIEESVDIHVLVLIAIHNHIRRDLSLIIADYYFLIIYIYIYYENTTYEFIK